MIDGVESGHEEASLILAVTAMALVLFSGCARVTRANYAKIHSGMTMEEVVKILGEPNDMGGIGIGPLEASTARWDGKEGSIRIQFVGQKVRIKTFHASDGAKAPRQNK